MDRRAIWRRRRRHLPRHRRAARRCQPLDPVARRRCRRLRDRHRRPTHDQGRDRVVWQQRQARADHRHRRDQRAAWRDRRCGRHDAPMDPARHVPGLHDRRRPRRRSRPADQRRPGVASGCGRSTRRLAGLRAPAPTGAAARRRATGGPTRAEHRRDSGEQGDTGACDEPAFRSRRVRQLGRWRSTACGPRDPRRPLAAGQGLRHGGARGGRYEAGPGRPS